MDFDEFDRYDFTMNDDDEPRRKKASTQPGGCMLVMIASVTVCVTMLLWVIQ